MYPLPFIAILLLASGIATAQSPAPADHSAHHPPAPAPGTAAADFSTAEVRRVDREAQKVTLRHGPIPHLGMPDNMTMVFRVADPRMLDGLKAGDRIQFKADKIGGQYTVTALAAAR